MHDTILGKISTQPHSLIIHAHCHTNSVPKTNRVSNWSTSFVSDVKFKLQPVTSVENQLARLKTNKASGLDSISARLLRDSSDVIAPPLTYLINMSFRTGVFPDMWECAKVMALFKKGDKHDRDNYRPISILPTVSKVIDRFVHLQLYGRLTQNKILFDNQFGFRQRRSTASALCRFTDDLLSLVHTCDITT